jgi:hypothetical protein
MKQDGRSRVCMGRRRRRRCMEALTGPESTSSIWRLSHRGSATLLACMTQVVACSPERRTRDRCSECRLHAHERDVCGYRLSS